LHRAQAPAVLDHSRTLPQGDGSAWPAFAGGAIGGERNLIVLDAGDVLDDAFAVRRPGIDAEGEVRSRRGHLRPLLLHSSWGSLFSAGASEFFILSQSGERPERYIESLRFDTMPSSPILQAWAKTVGPSPSRCSLKRKPRPALASVLRSVALRTSRGSRRRSSPFSSTRSKAYRNVLSSWRR